MSSKKFALIALTMLGATGTTLAEPADMDGVKTPAGKVVAEYLALQWGKNKNLEAAKKLVSPNLIEHGYLGAGAAPQGAPPAAAQGAPPAGAPAGGGDGGAVIEAKKVIAQGDMVFVLGHGKRGNEGNGDLMWILYRVKDGKIVEHWDTHNAIPDNQVGKQW